MKQSFDTTTKPGHVTVWDGDVTGSVEGASAYDAVDFGKAKTPGDQAVLENMGIKMGLALALIESSRQDLLKAAGNDNLANREEVQIAANNLEHMDLMMEPTIERICAGFGLE